MNLIDLKNINNLRLMKIIVTGSSGFIGYHLAQNYRTKSHCLRNE